jgi:hypothetical protein
LLEGAKISIREVAVLSLVTVIKDNMSIVTRDLPTSLPRWELLIHWHLFLRIAFFKEIQSFKLKQYWKEFKQRKQDSFRVLIERLVALPSSSL